MKTLSEIIKINLPKISLLDVGAMKTSESDRYESLLKSNLIEVIGFEANLSEYIKLKNIIEWNFFLLTIVFYIPLSIMFYSFNDTKTL